MVYNTQGGRIVPAGYGKSVGIKAIAASLVEVYLMWALRLIKLYDCTRPVNPDMIIVLDCKKSLPNQAGH